MPTKKCIQLVEKFYLKFIKNFHKFYVKTSKILKKFTKFFFNFQKLFI